MDSIRQALYSATGPGASRIVKAQAAIYERITLSQEVFSDACLNLILEILSVEELFSKPGIEEFLLRISTGMYLLTANQKRQLLNVISANYSQYENIELCWLLGDMIARSWDQVTALQTFRRLFKSATDQGKEGIVLGLDIVAKHSKRDPFLMERIDAILKEA